LHYDDSAAVDFEYVPAAFLAHFVVELDRRQSLLKQLYVPGILDTRNEKLCLLEDCPSATWNRITCIDRVRTLQPFLKRKIAELFDESLQELKFGVVYCNLLLDSWAAEDQVLLPFLYRRQDVAWAQQYLGWPLEDMGHNMRSVVIAGHTQEDREKDILRHYNLTADSQAFRRVAVLSQKCSRCSGKPAERGRYCCSATDAGKHFIAIKTVRSSTGGKGISLTVVHSRNGETMRPGLLL